MRFVLIDIKTIESINIGKTKEEIRMYLDNQTSRYCSSSCLSLPSIYIHEEKQYIANVFPEVSRKKKKTIILNYSLDLMMN